MERELTNQPRTRRVRRPVHIEQAGGKGSRQRAWEEIRKWEGRFTCRDIARRTKVDDETLYTYLMSLQKAGFLDGDDMTGAERHTRKTWQLIKDNGVEAPRLTKDGKPVTQGMGNEAMWRSMRIIGEFNTTELAAHAATSGVNVSQETAKTYIGDLKKAGYLVVVAEARSRGFGKGNMQARYRLAPGKYTGPRPPMVQRTKSVYDPNIQKVVWQEEPANVDDL